MPETAAEASSMGEKAKATPATRPAARLPLTALPRAQAAIEARLRCRIWSRL